MTIVLIIALLAIVAPAFAALLGYHKQIGQKPKNRNPWPY